MIFAAIIIVHHITNFCISYHQGGVSDKEWTAGDFAVSSMDAMASKISPVFPRTMLKMATGSTIVLVVFLGTLVIIRK